MRILSRLSDKAKDRLIVGLAGMLAVMFCLGGLNLVYSAWLVNTRVSHAEQRITSNEQQSDRRWCSLLGTLILPEPGAPPLTARQRKVLSELTDLHRGFHCPDRSTP